MSKVLVAAVMSLMIAASVPQVSAASSDSWTYATSMEFAGVNATGNITYTLHKQEDVKVGGQTYAADVLSVRGQVSGSTISGLLSIVSVISGTRVTASQGIATISEDTIQYINLTFGGGTQPLVVPAVVETVMNFTPPQLIKFNPDKTKPGDSWTETDTLNETNSVNGTVSPLLSMSVTYEVSVDPTRETITTPAGTFETLKITVDGPFENVIYWWSSKAQNFVVKKTYNPLSSAPTSVMTLKSFHLSLGSEVLIITLAGLAVVIVALVVLVAIMRARKPRQPVYQPPEAGPPSPPG